MTFLTFSYLSLSSHTLTSLAVAQVSALHHALSLHQCVDFTLDFYPSYRDVDHILQISTKVISLIKPFFSIFEYELNFL